MSEDVIVTTRSAIYDRYERPLMIKLDRAIKEREYLLQEVQALNNYIGRRDGIEIIQRFARARN